MCRQPLSSSDFAPMAQKHDNTWTLKSMGIVSLAADLDEDSLKVMVLMNAINPLVLYATVSISKALYMKKAYSLIAHQSKRVQIGITVILI